MRPPGRSRPRKGVTRFRWQGCADGTAVEHLRLAGTGHGWPGVGVVQGKDPTGISTTDELFSFLRARGLTEGG